MKRDQKAAVVEEIARAIGEADAILAVDYRGLSVTQAAELRGRLAEAGAKLRIVKNTLTERAADQAGAEALKELLEGPTAFTFVQGDAALAAKAISQFRRQNDVPQFKGGTLDGKTLSIDEIESIARLPGQDVLRGQLVGVLASPMTGLVRGLGQLIGGLAVALGEIQEKGLVGGDGDSAAEETAPEESPPEESPPEEASGEQPTEGEAVEDSGEGGEGPDEGAPEADQDSNEKEG